jgi:hypothetical protein
MLLNKTSCVGLVRPALVDENHRSSKKPRTLLSSPIDMESIAATDMDALDDIYRCRILYE